MTPGGASHRDTLDVPSIITKPRNTSISAPASNDSRNPMAFSTSTPSTSSHRRPS